MYEKVQPAAAGLLMANDGQGIYWEESGSPEGIPLVYLHGGPGGGLGTRGYVTKADPSRFRIIGLDQRGCGKSVPLAVDPKHDLAANTTARLIADLEELREHLGIQRWVINGVSWGSTLAIAYAQAHPQRVLGVVAMAGTTTSRWEVDWITETVGAIYPEEWELFVGHAEQAVPGYHRGQSRLVETYRQLIRHPDLEVRDAASHAWARWEDAHIAIGTGGIHRDLRWEDKDFRHNFVTLVTHYWANDGFCDPPLLDRIDRLTDIPAVLIHGRLDVSGPLRTAWELHQRWPGSRLVIDEGEGHGGSSMVEAWRQANDDMASRLLR
ncbi:alpha/beta fold hydrolase [Nesterenkonia massiliensis]|uniref:Proline iminopeptidase n=1 Tax=Nesterenkonia massiliensis TaxID=1232429 RepID=A0ABT2HTF1_9MICC|nr:alpha/beta fold hydrolase [Nesterenkonia massiliensis]MCT1607981.1 alpha/beta fold hydrolase [Nesterenkonia massiliensis]